MIQERGPDACSFPGSRAAVSAFFCFFLFVFSMVSLCLCDESLRGEPPVASYLFPAGGRRGATVDVHVGGLFLHKDACWELLGPGVTLASPHLGPASTLWFEGPMLPLTESQQAEDYP